MPVGALTEPEGVGHFELIDPRTVGIQISVAKNAPITKATMATITPAFNQTNAWSAVGTTGLVFPVYKQFSFSVGALDDFLNDPAAGSKKNSFQFTAGVTYTLK